MDLENKGNISITVFHLSSCGNCKQLLQGLAEANIEYESIDANRYSTLAMKVENFLGIKHYPIILISGTIQVSEPDFLKLSTSRLPVYLDLLTDLTQPRTISIKSATKVSTTSVDEMIEFIKN